jgi:hypothetical protein
MKPIKNIKKVTKVTHSNFHTGRFQNTFPPAVFLLDTLPLIILNDPSRSRSLHFQNRWTTKQVPTMSLYVMRKEYSTLTIT